ncbi:MAG: hypothetical protein WBA12_08935, partial [Catalinimonas sp.]
PPPPPPPPPPPAQSRLLVNDTQLGDEGLRNARVVARRWFKIQRVWTDDQGFYRITKRFRNKVKLHVKFKNQFATIRALRGTRLWQTLFAVRDRLGTFQGNELNTAATNFTYRRDNSAVNTPNNRIWVAATTHNSVQNYRTLATAQGVGQPPMGMKVLLTTWAAGGGAAPMYHQRLASRIPPPYASWFIASPPSALASRIQSLITLLSGQVDIVYNYNNAMGWGNFVSDRMYRTLFEELGHAAHYAKVGDFTYGQFVTAVEAEIARHTVSDPQFSPYGTGNTSNSPIIAVSEAWGGHIGLFFSDLRYGLNVGCRGGQPNPADPRFALPICPFGGQGTYARVLEEWSPANGADRFNWIPIGLMFDLIDDNTPPAPGEPTGITQVVDGVVGYTNQQLFNALDADVQSVPAFEARLLQENGNNQQAQVNQLFDDYGY